MIPADDAATQAWERQVDTAVEAGTDPFVAVVDADREARACPYFQIPTHAGMTILRAQTTLTAARAAGDTETLDRVLADVRAAQAQVNQCTLEAGHGPLHRDANGAEWLDPDPDDAEGCCGGGCCS